MLAFALVHVQLHGLAVAAVEGLVFVEHDLDEVVAGGKVFEAADGISPGGIVELRGPAGLPSIDGEAKEDWMLSFSTRSIEPM